MSIEAEGIYITSVTENTIIFKWVFCPNSDKYFFIGKDLNVFVQIAYNDDPEAPVFGSNVVKILPAFKGFTHVFECTVQGHFCYDPPDSNNLQIRTLLWDESNEYSDILSVEVGKYEKYHASYLQQRVAGARYCGIKLVPTHGNISEADPVSVGIYQKGSNGIYIPDDNGIKELDWTDGSTEMTYRTTSPFADATNDSFEYKVVIFDKTTKKVKEIKQLTQNSFNTYVPVPTGSLKPAGVVPHYEDHISITDFTYKWTYGI